MSLLAAGVLPAGPARAQSSTSATEQGGDATPDLQDAKDPRGPQSDTAVRVRARLGEGVSVHAGDLLSLQLRLRLQLRAGFSDAPGEAVAAGADDGLLTELMVRRARLQLQGHAFTPTLRYYVQLGFSPRDQEPNLPNVLRDARITWQFHRDIGIRAGQMKVPFGLQRVISSSALQFADRSIVTGELSLDRDIGIVLLSDDLFGLDGLLQYQVGVFGGRGRNRFGSLDAALFAGRVQVSPFGGFDTLDEPDHERSATPRLSLGLSAGYNIDSNRGRSTHGSVFDFARFDTLHLGADVSFKYRGLSVLAETLMRDASKRSVTQVIDGAAVTEYSRSAWGWFAQAGYLFAVPFEVAARYGEIHPFDNAAGADFALRREVGGALSYYFFDHALKLQGDYFYYFGDDPRQIRHQVRIQAQLYL